MTRAWFIFISTEIRAEAETDGNHAINTKRYSIDLNWVPAKRKLRKVKKGSTAN